MKCQDPEACNKRHADWKGMQTILIPKGEEVHERLVYMMEEEGLEIPRSRHTKKRQVFRAFSEKTILTAIKEGWVIEYNTKRNTLLIQYFAKVAEKKYRPIHVVLRLEDGTWKIATVYDPRSMPWKWSKNYSERVCFCKND